jgi:predicted RNA-binding protein associated with RNAse of E/G family
VDLALDLVVLPDGRWVVVDQDEFAGLRLTPEERKQAAQALERLQGEAAKLQGEFGAVRP